ncbi:MAG: hypothetical protein PHE56_08195 [Bacteroidales bacterium]|nr:hypothetical protein [Bacteroidales bacterium]
MRQFDAKIRISAETEEQFKEKYKALVTIENHLSVEDLKTISDEIRKNPAIIKKVKDLANNPIVRRMI